MRRPFLGPYLFNWHDNERTALELLEQNGRSSGSSRCSTGRG